MQTSFLALFFLAAVSASTGHAAAAGSAAPGKPVADLQLNIDRGAKGTLEVTFQNVGKEAMFVNLGAMLGNERTLIPSQLQLVITSASGKSRTLPWKGPAGVAGRTDNFLVPLMPGAKYTLVVTFDEFLSSSGGGLAKQAAGEAVQAVYQGVVRVHPGIPSLPVWTDKVESGTLAAKAN